MSRVLIRSLLLIIAVCIQYMSASAQTIEWQKALGGSGFDVTSSVIPSHDTGYLVCGQAFSFDGDVSLNHGSSDVWVVKLTNTGSSIWEKSYGGSGKDAGSKVRATTDGGYIVVGTTASSDGDIAVSHGSEDVWVVKLDHAGSIEWEKCYGGTGEDVGYDIRQTFDGGYIIGGYTTTPDNGDVIGFHGGFGSDCWVLKIDDTGAVLWQNTLGGTQDESVIVIRQTLDTGFIFGGYSRSGDGDITNYRGGTYEGGDCWVVKLDKTGEMQWQKTYGGRFEEQVFDILEVSRGSYLIGAATRSTDGDVIANNGQIDGWIFNLDDTGGIVWQKNYGGASAEYVTGLVQVADGFVFTGWSDYVWIGKIDVAGNLLWEGKFGGTKADMGWGICPANDEGFVIAGTTSSDDGDVTGFHGGRDMWILKVVAPVGISVLSGHLSLINVFPNPANDMVTIDGVEDDAEVCIIDVSGRIVKKEKLVKGRNVVNIADLISGVYQLQLTTVSGEQMYTRLVKVY